MDEYKFERKISVKNRFIFLNRVSPHSDIVDGNCRYQKRFEIDECFNFFGVTIKLSMKRSEIPWGVEYYDHDRVFNN